MQLDKICRDVIELSKDVGRYISDQEFKIKKEAIESKSLNNFVSFVDKTAEEKFVNGLLDILPEAGIIAEEGHEKKSENEYRWIIDPLDGTTNFLHHIPFYATSVALEHNNKIVLGVVYAPGINECYSAWKGGGAFLNEKPISVSKAQTLASSLLATGFPYDDFSRDKAYMNVLKNLTTRTRGIRRIGSAAIDLVYVAVGRFDAFYEYGLNAWDVAAGIIIVQEAGGKITDFNGNENFLFGEEIIASNFNIHLELQTLIAKEFET